MNLHHAKIIPTSLAQGLSFAKFNFAQCLSACLPPRHPNSLWLSYRPRVIGIGFSQTKREWCWEGCHTAASSPQPNIWQNQFLAANIWQQCPSHWHTFFKFNFVAALFKPCWMGLQHHKPTLLSREAVHTLRITALNVQRH